LFGKTVREAPSDAVNISYKLLYKAGFIRESTSGRYFTLPLGQRVQRKIMEIVKDEMDKTGAQEMLSPVLHPLELWKETNRTKTTGFELMTIKDRRGADFALGGTAEEMFVDVVRKFQISYKDLPFNIYQFSSKFRDELRARGGLLRVREFIMKDAYSFDVDEKEFKKEYQNMWQTYTKIFERMGLKTFVVESDNGYIGGEYCHEFVVESEIGETNYLMTEDGKYAAHQDVAKFKREDINSKDKEKPFKIIEQPEWVQTMEDNVKHYKLSKSHFLKNVVYKNRTTGEIIIAVVRGDLEVNKLKLEHVLDAVGQLEDATLGDLKKIGTKPGYVHSWGHKKAKYIGDISLLTVKNFIGGQKEEKTDSMNVNYGKDFKCELADIALAKEGYLSETGKKLIEKKGIEVGNIFQLGLHYSSKMKNSTYIDKDGKEKPYYMGCYGIGIGRTMATIIEKFHDEKGIIWPEAVAPYQIHLIGLDIKNEEIKKKAFVLYNLFTTTYNLEVLFDDREEVTAGEKFADADLIGIPIRLVVSKRTGNKIEYKKRNEKEVKILSIEEVLKFLISN
ncbi:MAG: proline--tRNA ligase, partial [Patescibacteria group bacterium]